MNEPCVPPIVAVRGKRMVLDTGAALLYGTTDANLRRIVNKRHDRFPDDFLVRLSPAESVAFKAKLAFTPEGLAMLAAVLDTPLARNSHVNMMRAFVVLDRMAFQAGGI